MNRFEKIALIGLGPVVVCAALFFIWSANYAAASFFVQNSTAMWTRFTGDDMMMPVKQVWAYWPHPVVQRLFLQATIATLAQSVIIVAGIALLILRPWEVRPPANGSRFASLKDLEQSGLTHGKPGTSILLGTFGEGRAAVDIRYSGDSHFFVNGPSRSGKGRGFVMTNLLEYAGSVIVLDIKLENYAMTGPSRMAMGQACFVFAPGSHKSHRWNPLDFVRGWPERATDLINLAATLLPISEREEAYWKQTARGLMAALIGYVLESETMHDRRNLRSVLRLFSTGKSLSDVLQTILDKEPELNDFVLAGLRQHLARDPEQRLSFEGHIVTVLAPFNNRLMAAACSASDFDIRDLRRRPFSLFIASPVSDFGTVEPLIRLLIQQIHDCMLRFLPGSDEPHKVLMMLDEFYQFERLPEIIKRAPLVAGYGLTIALIAQSIPQIDERYGQKTRDALIGNMDIKLFIAVGDETTAKFVSTHLGRKYEEREGWGRHQGFLMSRKASQGRFELVPLMEPDAVQRLDNEKTILQIRSGFGVILNKLNFYTQERFIARRRQVEAFARDLTIPAISPPPEWPLFDQRPLETDTGIAVQFFQPARPDPPDYDAIVLERCRDIFDPPASLMHVYRQAVVASDDQPIADLLFRLRTEPQTIAPLRGTQRALDLPGRRLRKAALATIWPLREAIIQARWAIIAERLKEPAVVHDDLDVPLQTSTFHEEDEEATLEDEENRLDQFFKAGEIVLGDIENLVGNEITSGRAADATALSRALANLRSGFQSAMAEPVETNQLSLRPREIAEQHV